MTDVQAPKEDVPAIVPQVIVPPIKAPTMSRTAFALFIALAVLGVAGVVILIVFVLRYIQRA